MNQIKSLNQQQMLRDLESNKSMSSYFIIKKPQRIYDIIDLISFTKISIPLLILLVSIAE